MTSLLLGWACVAPGEPDGDTERPGAQDSASHGDSSPESTPVDVDVLVIGSGPAGLSAAWEAREAGASVLVLERDALAGGSGWHGGAFFAAGTRFQEERGTDDSVEQALADWEALVGQPPDALVEHFVEDSAELVAWLVDDFGARVAELRTAPGQLHAPPRLHQLELEAWGPVGGLVDALADDTRTGTTATALLGDDRIEGVRVVDGSGVETELRAGAVVVATGGFARDVERVVADRSELGDYELVAEAAPTSDGGGHALLEAAEVPLRPGAVGAYVHAFEDWEHPGEAAVLMEVAHTLIVDGDGQRLVDESEALGLRLVEVLPEAGGGRLISLTSEARFFASPLARLGEGWDVSSLPTPTAGEAAVEAGAVSAGTVDELAALLEVEVDQLAATVERYEALAADGVDGDQGKDPGYLHSLGDALVAVPLSVGVAKVFGGVSLDEDGRVLDEAGAPVPGLYAAGEVAGMLGTDAVGDGFEGSITAVYLGGRAAGRAAAAEALSR